MTKKFALVLVALLVVPLVIAACGTESRDAAEDYVIAAIKGEDDKALGLACDSFKEGTQTLLAYYKEQDIHPKTIDLKFDIGKGNNQKEIIVTGSYKYWAADMPREFELTEKNKSRIVLDMKKVSGDWCATENSEFEGTPLSQTGGEG